MLRFNCFSLEATAGFSEFQYILCYGSTTQKRQQQLVEIVFQYILCYGSTVKTTYLYLFIKNFNTSYVTVQHLYFLTYSLNNPYFNTSYVTVQPFIRRSSPYILKDFNTSYVTVQQVYDRLVETYFRDFNTSYVTVQHLDVLVDGPFKKFQYILCYGSTFFFGY